VAVDVIAAELAAIPRQLLYIEQAAVKAGMPGSSLSSVRTVGVPLVELRTPLHLPHISDVQFGLPLFLKNRLRHHFTSRPFAIARKCRLCGICASACPPQAIEVKEGKLRFDYKRCIHCFCCRELCPDGALAVRQGMLLRLLARKLLFKHDP